MKKSIYLLLVVVFVITSGIGDTASAARRPDIISYDAELLQDAITVNITWQSEYPVGQSRCLCRKQATEGGTRSL